MDSLIQIIERHIVEAEHKAEASYKHRKWMMFGYWKAIAVHLRKVKREIRKELSDEKA